MDRPGDASGRPIWVPAGDLATNLRTIEAHPRLGVHYMIDRDGTVVASVAEDRIAHHVYRVSRGAIGIELVNDGDGRDPFPAPQIDALVDLLRGLVQRHGIGLGFMSFFTKAAVAALKAFPNVNAEIQGDEIVRKKYYDVGIAVAASEGLVVPIVRDADRKGFAEIERTIAQLAEKARNNTLTLEDLRGGTFTITNGGIFGSLMSTPILSPPSPSSGSARSRSTCPGTRTRCRSRTPS